MALPFSDDELRATAEAFRTHPTPAAAAAFLGISGRSFTRRLTRAAKKGFLLPAGFSVQPGFEVVSVNEGPHGTTVRTRIEHGEEPVIPDHLLVDRATVHTDAEGRLITRWDKYKTDNTNAILNVIEQTMEKYRGTSVIEPFEPCPARMDHLMSVYPIADQHHGLLAWGRETGESYDIKIGASRLRSCARRLIKQSPRSETALILNLGDWQHTDDQKNMTPGHGNILDVDSRFFKIVETGILLFMDVIELALQQHEKVIVRNIPGNHDPHATVALTMALWNRYHNNDRVEIIRDPSDFFYREFGATLIGATHGHKLKPEVMAMDMATTQRAAWGRTKYHWFLHGHIHHEVVKEIGDCRVESFQTLAAKDAYARSHGYNAGQSLTSITLDYDEGEIGRHRINIPPPGTE